MSRKRSMLLAIPASLVILALVAFKSVDFKTSKSLDIFFSFFRELSIFYVDEIDAEKAIYAGIDAILESLDPYNEFIPEEGADALEFQTTGEYGGMGALIRHAPDYPLIAEVYEGSPAHKAGLLAGDKILNINGEDVENRRVDLVSNMLKGAPKTELRIVVERYGHDEPLTFEFNREKIHIPSVPYYGMICDSIGYIRLANFTSNCDKEVEQALKNLKSKHNPSGLVLDLRSNPGGLLFEAIKIVNLFVDKGELVVYTQGKIKDFDQKYKTPNNPVDTQTPLVVLVDRISASASEIVAGALQDLDRAVVIGERTFGKGLVQATRPLPYNTQLKVTTAKYYIPSGRCIQAVDFTQRNEDGSISYIPDSLISEFTTRNGRKVYDGGGITPDIEHKVSMYSHIASVLFAQNMFFDYATRFRAYNQSIASPEEFNLTDDQYKQFITFLDSTDFTYQSPTERALNNLIKVSKTDNFYELAKGAIDRLEVVIKGERHKSLLVFEEEIKRLLEEEIVGRYYLQRGKAQYGLQNDGVITVARNLLIDSKKHLQILTIGYDSSDQTAEGEKTAHNSKSKINQRSHGLAAETGKTKEVLLPS